MANVPGAAGSPPSVFVENVTLSRGSSIPGGIRTASIMGEGKRVERLVTSAVGGGNDGLDSSFGTSGTTDGRHFGLSFAPIISNRLELFKNGIPLTGLEQNNFHINGGSSFSNNYDYRYDTTTGFIELQTAFLVDQGGLNYSTSSGNVGNGTITGLSLSDPNAPTETWSVRVSSVIRDGYGNPIDGYATFVVSGSVSGVILDGYGNQITWQSDGESVTNGILTFSIEEGATAFVEGDTFNIQVESGSLGSGDSLTANYIAVNDIGTPTFYQDFDALTTKHGAPSLENRLSLGAQLAFLNGAPGVWALQAAPAIPRRQSFVVEESASGAALADDLQFALPLGVIPDVDSTINFFFTDPVTGTETQVKPNKTDFYDASLTASPGLFHFTSTYTFGYTVILEDAVVKEGDDGVITSTGPTTATLSSTLVNFGADDTSGTRTVEILTPASNAGVSTIASVSDGVLTITNPAGFSDETDAEFRIIDSADSSAMVLLTDDLAPSAGVTVRITMIDTKDADFFDVGWLDAFEALETIDTDMVVPLPSQTISAIFQNGRIHVDTMSSLKNKRERMLFIGSIQGLTPDNIIGNSLAAVEDIGVLEGIQGDDVSEILAGNIEDLADYEVQASFGTTFRVVWFHPDQIVMQIGGTRSFVDGFFMAAAAAGRLAAIQNIAVPLTNKQLSGFTILSDKLYRPLVIEQLVGAGISVVQPAIGGGTVIWGKTTTTSGFAEEEEVSIVFIRDRIAKSMRTAFRGFIGTAESSTTQGSLTARANGMLQSFITQGLITDFRDLQVKRDEVEPRQWNVRVAVQPTYPINWVYIRINVGLL